MSQSVVPDAARFSPSTSTNCSVRTITSSNQSPWSGPPDDHLAALRHRPDQLPHPLVERQRMEEDEPHRRIVTTNATQCPVLV